MTRSKTGSTPIPKAHSIKPMLATLSASPVDDPSWLLEIKWDGYRAIAYCNKSSVEISSRNNKSFNEKFYPVTDALKKLKLNAVIDGEIVVFNDKGLPDFGRLQSWRSEADGHLAFYAFDILWKDGKDLTSLPLSERRKFLEKIIPKGNDLIKLSETFDAHAGDFFQLAAKMKIEGIMAKDPDSTYIPGARSKEWLKIKTELRQEAVIGGYTINENTSKPFSALLLGIYENGGLQPIGSVGTGFSIAQQNELLKRFKKLEVKKCPFAFVPDFNKPSRFRPDPPKAEAVWLKPELVCEISYRELTADKALRHPSFKGIREDKSPKEVTWEVATPSPEIEKAPKGIATRRSSNIRTTLLTPGVNSQVRSVNGHEINFNNLNKFYWPKEKITKGEMINYYYQVAPYMLPHLEGRPQTLHRYPNGITGKKFYQKDVKGKVPEWIDTFPYYSEAEEQEKEFLICNNEATLLYVASMGSIEINTWCSKVNRPSNPDYCIIDLDPDKNTFNQVIETALLTREILKTINADCYCKTSGSTGLHIYIPLGGKYDYEDSKELGRRIATILHNQVPGYTSIERQTINRGGKMYIDFLQNRPQATVAAVYSIRPKPGATVSMPLHWDEVRKGLKIQDFTIKNAPARINETGDIFKPVLGKGINLKKAMKDLEKEFLIL